MIDDLKVLLDSFYRTYDFKQRLRHDPIEFPHRYKTPEDIEAAGFIACCFAYGRVDLFKPVIERILSVMGGSPYEFLYEFSVSRDANRFRGIQYRFNKDQDIVSLCHILHETIKKEGSIQNEFMRHYHAEDEDIGNALSGLIRTFLSVTTSEVYGKDLKPAGLRQFFPSPEGGSSCKRLNLFLRWMVRDRDIDFGVWNGIPRHKLVIPLDTHIMKISQCLGFTRRKSADWKTAIEITAALKIFDPSDPLKYDFALCHQGISGVCKGPGSESDCSKCEFRPHNKSINGR